MVRHGEEEAAGSRHNALLAEGGECLRPASHQQAIAGCWFQRSICIDGEIDPLGVLKRIEGNRKCKISFFDFFMRILAIKIYGWNDGD